MAREGADGIDGEKRTHMCQPNFVEGSVFRVYRHTLHCVESGISAIDNLWIEARVVSWEL